MTTAPESTTATGGVERVGSRPHSTPVGGAGTYTPAGEGTPGASGWSVVIGPGARDVAPLLHAAAAAAADAMPAVRNSDRRPSTDPGPVIRSTRRS
ncbi:hypothetical protein GCM10023200_29010 [Actinomycetospora chlora]|uniref:Uncharacterized protein n=1 Tax=Actinomycetospora chlora TaxID=663608 RepID=A0ABP9BBJ1_9PSEU